MPVDTFPLFYRNFIPLEFEITGFQMGSLKQHCAYKIPTQTWLLYHLDTIAWVQQWRQDKLQRFFVGAYFRSSLNVDEYLR